MGQFVIAAYRPKPGNEAEVLACVRDHLPILRGEGLVTERAPYAMRAKNGTIIEIFEWKSAEAINHAHTNKAVMALWERFAVACDNEVVAKVPECKEMFAVFEPIDLYRTR